MTNDNDDTDDNARIVLFAAQFKPEIGLVGTAGDATHIFGTFDYALLLLRRGGEEDIARASVILAALEALQRTDEQEPNVGWLPLAVGATWVDGNAPLFLLPRLFALLDAGAGKVDASTAERMERMARRMALGAERRWDDEDYELQRDHFRYSNVWVLYVQSLLLAGARWGDDRLLRKGAHEWRRWFNHLAYYGLDEFASPTYNNIEWDALLVILGLAQSDRMRREVALVLDYLARLQHALCHPGLKMQVSGASRDYRKFLKPGDQEGASVRFGKAQSEINGYRVPAAITEEYRARTFPHAASGRAGAFPYRFQTYQTERAALGSMTGGAYFWQQIHCLAAVGNRDEREVIVLPGRYTATPGYVAQNELTALCVWGRRGGAHTLHRTQWFTPDDNEAVRASLGDFGIGTTWGWVVDDGDEVGALVFRAHGHAVYVRPFVLTVTNAAATVTPVRLTREERDNIGQKFGHKGAASLVEYVFPADAEWFGCTIVIGDNAAPPPPAAFWQARAARDGDYLSVTAGPEDGAKGALGVSLLLQPFGVVTETYNDEPRAAPLLASSVGAVWPGEMAFRAANPDAAL